MHDTGLQQNATFIRQQIEQYQNSLDTLYECLGETKMDIDDDDDDSDNLIEIKPDID